MSGQSFSVASISTTKVCRVRRLMCALPNALFRQLFVSPINLCQNPPYQGALFGMNFGYPLSAESDCEIYSGEQFSQFLRSQQIGRALSDITVWGKPL